MFSSLADIVSRCESEKKDFAAIVVEAECDCTQKDEAFVRAKMENMWKVMLEANDAYEPNLLSRSGLSGRDGGRFDAYAQGGGTICGAFMSKVIAAALKMAESNACMKRIVAAPTAGSCGVLPSVLVSLYREGKFSDERIIDALFVSAGIGQVIANRSSIAGAQGGCQAEIGAASAMAAGSLVYLYGGDSHQIVAAVAVALQNLLGLVCDPVAGLVEVPCVKRNVIGAVNACSCADMALAGIVPRIPADEVIDAMKRVGDSMNPALKETGQGGIASSPTAKQIASSL